MHSSHLPGTPEDTRNLHPHIDRTSAASVPARTPRGTSPPSPGSLGQRRRTHHALSGRRCLAHTLIPKLPAATDRFGAGGWVEQGNRPDSSESLPRNPPHFLPLSSPGFAPSAPQLLAFSPGMEQAAGVWETCLAPGWPQLRSRLPFGPRSQASLHADGLLGSVRDLDLLCL